MLECEENEEFVNFKENSALKNYLSQKRGFVNKFTFSEVVMHLNHSTYLILPLSDPNQLS